MDSDFVHLLDAFFFIQMNGQTCKYFDGILYQKTITKINLIRFSGLW